MRAVGHDVIRPDVVPILKTVTKARAIRTPQPAPWWLFSAHVEACSPPESFDAFVMHRPAFPAQESGEAPRPRPSILRGHRDEARNPPGCVVRDDRPRPVRRPRLPAPSASPPLRGAQPVLDMHPGRASPGRAQTCPEAISCRSHVIERLVGHQLLQRRVFLLEGLQALRLVETPPAVLLPPAGGTSAH